MDLRALVLGRRLANQELTAEKLGVLEGVPAMGLDGLGSSSYGPEAALAVLVSLGSLGLDYVVPIIGIIVALLVVLFLSYRQTLLAYPENGGAYLVAKVNLGENASLCAAASLIVDYVLNVAVGVSAGVGALVSAVPVLHSYTLVSCLAVVLVVMLANLRGTAEAGWVFALPTYVFLGCFLVVLGIGSYRLITSGGSPAAVIPPPPLAAATGPASMWLLLHAFASGCTAMTGVEAVSNGVGAFREPVVVNARRTLTIIVVALALLLAGIAVLARGYGVAAMDQNHAGYQSVPSQLVAAIVGRGFMYYTSIASLLCILCLSANTSFVGFPRLCRAVALDGYLPRAFALPGRRLVFTVGIAFLGAFGAALLIGFGGITDRLIPLFAIGAFSTFTISQAGMVVHWHRQPGRHLPRLLLNAFGAVATGTALVIIAIAKLEDGAWITLIAVPLVIVLLRSVRAYYRRLEAEVAERGPIQLEEVDAPTVLVVARQWDRLSEKAIKLALTLSPDVVAVHLFELEGPEAHEDERALRERWKRHVEDPVAARGLNPPRLMLVPTPFRRLAEPLLQLTRQLDAEQPERAVAVLIPETVKSRWWQHLLHTHRAARLRKELLQRGGPRLTVITVPWQLGG